LRPSRKASRYSAPLRISFRRRRRNDAARRERGGRNVADIDLRHRRVDRAQHRIASSL
jgi:hypothetical protein